MLEKNNSNWEYGLFIVERENNPYLKKIKEFDLECEATINLLYLE